MVGTRTEDVFLECSGLQRSPEVLCRRCWVRRSLALTRGCQQGVCRRSRGAQGFSLLPLNESDLLGHALELEKLNLTLNVLSDLTIENLIGAKENLNNIELALQAELIHRLTSRNVRYQPKDLVKTVVRYIGYSERLSRELKERFDEVLRNWNG